MKLFRQTLWLFAALVLVLGSGGLSHAQTRGGRRPPAVLDVTIPSNFLVPQSVLKGAKVYSYQQILVQTLADKSPDAAEVHTYLANPVQWQKNLSKIKAYELGLPQSRVILADGSIIRTYARPQIPKGWQYHLFSDPAPRGFMELTIYNPGHLYIIQTPPGSQLLQALQFKSQTIGNKQVTSMTFQGVPLNP
jgi:hypothetical protein